MFYVLVEVTQRRAIKLICSIWRVCVIRIRVKHLGLMDSDTRTDRIDLIETFKIINDNYKN